jgi:hypothetical protein
MSIIASPKDLFLYELLVFFDRLFFLSLACDNRPFRIMEFTGDLRAVEVGKNSGLRGWDAYLFLITCNI